ncbi:hypothetical protein K491DRAFT_676263 [Lophiostoma macrostomum CBS 122681]|uniref:Uncharacterized protein n=1 Tax=Lophiostoma macrostomum CBS 122681 TaxID=1314788 RepID=A0A6A6TIC0_9PLEO|nr:hypothetical protein K491DRAFT_676263 [Lophiostoma macrostomum CBS 122681]
MARRSESATPVPGPTRQTRSGRGASSEAAPVPKSLLSQHSTSVGPSKATKRTHSRKHSTSNSNPASQKPKMHLSTPSTSDEATCNAFGESRFATEDVMMKDHAQCLLEAGAIDAEQAARLSVPWHEKGVLNGPVWDDKYLDPSRKADIEIMSLEKARKIQARKDAKMKKWLADWEAGRIDENGNAIVQSVVTSDGIEDEDEDEDEDGFASDGSESEVEVVPVKKKLHGRVLRAQKPQLTPIAEEKSSIMATPLPAPPKPVLQPAPNPQKSTISRPPCVASVGWLRVATLTRSGTA